MRVGGLDLSAKEGRCSGYSVIDVPAKRVLKVKCLFTDNDIVSEVIEDSLDVIAVDAPLTPEPGMREVDRVMIKSGFKVFPPSFRWMRDLTLRAWKLKGTLEGKGVEVLETHPRSALVSSGTGSLLELLESLGVECCGDVDRELVSNHRDLRDSLICALVAYLHTIGRVKEVRARDGVIYLIPDLRSLSR